MRIAINRIITLVILSIVFVSCGDKGKLLVEAAVRPKGKTVFTIAKGERDGACLCDVEILAD